MRSWRTRRRAGRAQSGPQRELAATPRGAGQQQAGDVGAGDGQEEAGGREQEEQRGTGVADDFVVQGDDRRATEGGLRVFGGDAGGDAIEVGPRPFDRHSRTQAPHHVQEIVAPSVEQVSRRERHRQPELGAPVGEPEGRRHHADHGVGSAVEGHRRAQDRRAPTEPVAPQRVAEENDAIGAGDLFVRAKGAAQERPHAEQREHPRAGAGGR